MKNKTDFDVVIIGGSYAGLSAALALGRALRKVLIIDNGNPCNMRAPEAHNFITWDGAKPENILSKAREDLRNYGTISFLNETLVDVSKTNEGFELHTDSKANFSTKKIVFATGIVDVMPEINNFQNCWGISILHCPYCHGYEAKGKKTGVLANGIHAFDLCMVLKQWTNDILLMTNGRSHLTEDQELKLKQHKVTITERKIHSIGHKNGRMSVLHFEDDERLELPVMYAKPDFKQQFSLPEKLGCKMTAEGLIEVDETKKTSVHGIYAAGDNSSEGRMISLSVAAGTVAGIMLNGELSSESF
jgi:thioredoxin reductase